MPTPSCHAQGLLSGMMQSASDRIAFIAAGVVGTTPIWWEAAKQVSEVGATLGPGLAALYVVSKIILTWVQIWRAARGDVVSHE